MPAFRFIIFSLLFVSYFLERTFYMSQTENSFKNSLRNFQLSRNNDAAIALPTNISGPNSAFQSFRDSASNVFSNVTSSVQGYIPVGGNGEEDEEPWYQLSRVEVSICW